MHSLNEGKRGESAPRQLSGRGLAYWTDGRDGADRLRHARLPDGRARCEDRASRPGLRQERRRRSEARQRSADGSRSPARSACTPRRSSRATSSSSAPRICRAASRRAGTTTRDTSAASTCGPASGCGSSTRFRWPASSGAETWEDDSRRPTRQHRRLGADERRRGAGPRLPARRAADRRLLRRASPGQRPVRREPRRRRSEDRATKRWHYQLVHHGIWDFDIPCAPILADIVVDGRAIKALAQPTKQGWVYVLDRTTGQPVWPIEERPVEASTVPGEKASPTQPFVTKPPAFDRQGVSIDDLIDFTPELRAEAVKLVSRYKIGPLFTPPVVSKWEGPLATLDVAVDDRRRELAGRGRSIRKRTILYIYSSTQIADLGARSSRTGSGRTCATSAGTARESSAAPASRRCRAAGAAGEEAAPPAHRAGSAAGEAAVRAHHRDRSQQGRHRLADRARRDARQHPQSSGAQRADHPADRAASGGSARWSPRRW